ncbi:MAG: hypothetical protein M0Z79_07465 [Nitrospiraceae bacterium]|nr:hypothetical protein [Nitrospiraceae bacterium]
MSRTRRPLKSSAIPPNIPPPAKGNNRVPDEASLDELIFLRKEVRRLRKALSRCAPTLEMLLRRRGFTVYKKEPAEDLLIPGKKLLADYYRQLHKYSFRLFLRDVIKHQEHFTLQQATRYATPRVTAKYLRFITMIGLAREGKEGYRLVRRVRSFGETLEWYIAELCRREFGAEAVWGVKFKRPKVGGDYDVIARLDSSLLYIEVKSSPPKQIYAREIAAFLERVNDLMPEMAVFLMDTELRMKDKIVPMFEEELAKRYTERPEVSRMEKELFQINGRIYIINAKDSIIRNMEAVMSRYFRR